MLLAGLFYFILSCTPNNNPSPIVVEHPSDKIEKIQILSQNKSLPRSLGQWRFFPDIKVCKDSQYDEKTVNSALTWWTDQGHQFGPASYHITWGGCITGNPIGSILVTIPRSGYDFENYGSTTVYRDGEGYILWSVIEISHLKERVLEHELGHALGFGHYTKPGHIMHPIWKKGGWISIGLKKI
jgi:hypothetical protein